MSLSQWQPSTIHRVPVAYGMEGSWNCFSLRKTSMSHIPLPLDGISKKNSRVENNLRNWYLKPVSLQTKMLNSRKFPMSAHHNPRNSSSALSEHHENEPQIFLPGPMLHGETKERDMQESQVQEKPDNRTAASPPHWKPSTAESHVICRHSWRISRVW